MIGKLIRDLKSITNLTVIIAGLGYFVDLFDITLFPVVRVQSLNAIGIKDPDALLSAGVTIFNAQMIGMMLGGVIWGIMADRKGRLSVMFASILLYSIANIANVFVFDVPSYALCRFIGGIGLAGELGAAITLVAESLPPEKRGLGTTVVATLGMLGNVSAAIVGTVFSWQTSYLIGGAMGLLLLFSRMRMGESPLFKRDSTSVNRGNVFLLFQNGRWKRYLACVIVGTPIYFVTGVLVTFSPEVAQSLGVKDPVSAGVAIISASIGLALGDLLMGLISYWLKSRRKAIFLALACGYVLVLAYCFSYGASAKAIYVVCFLLGITIGYWAVLITLAAEQFGTNLRGTVATTVPNFVRGSAVILSTSLITLKAHFSAPISVLIVGTTCFLFAAVAIWYLAETFSRNLDFRE